MTPTRDPDSIRPSVALAGAAFLGLLALLTWGVVAHTRGESSASIEDEGERAGGRRIALLRDDEDDGDHVGRVRDPGAQGSVREQWARASEEGVRARSNEPIPPMIEALVDPQLSAFHSMWTEDEPPPFQPIEQRARILSSRGLPLDPDGSCDVRVLPVRGAGLSCLVRVMCGGTVVYPNPSQTAGYLNCSVDESGNVSGADHGPTTADGDPAIHLDPATGRVRISNLDWNGPGSAFEVEVAIDPGSIRNGV